MILSYPKVWNLGTPNVAGLFADEVVVQEKVDGSQFSFQKDEQGFLHFRSKGAEIFEDNVPDMFRAAVDTVRSVKGHMLPGFTYRGEVLCKPKHNTLVYDRVPKGNVVLFDVQDPQGEFVHHISLSVQANLLGLEAVPIFRTGRFDNVSTAGIVSLMETESFLGGQKIEGLVFKNYRGFNRYGERLFGKHVSERFKEKHQLDWRGRNPKREDLIESLTASLRTDARWQKAVQHLRDAGNLQQAPQDIGPLIRAVQEDVKVECEDEIKDLLFKHFWPKVSRGITAGLPEWYKQELLGLQMAASE